MSSRERRTPRVHLEQVDLGWVGATGNSAGFWYEQEEDATGTVGGTTTPCPIDATTSCQTAIAGFKPNIKIYWNEAP